MNPRFRDDFGSSSTASFLRVPEIPPISGGGKFGAISSTGRVVVGNIDFLAISGTLQIRAVLPDKNARSFGVFTLPGIVQIRRVFRQ